MVLVVVALGAGAPGASAVVTQLPDGTSLSYQPLRGTGPLALAPAGLSSNLLYDFGPVMRSNTNYTFYWEPGGPGMYPSDYRRGVDTFFRDLAHDSGLHENVDSVSTQYNDATGQFAEYRSRFGGALIDRTPYPPNGCNRAGICLTDAQIRAELEQVIAAHGLPMDLAHEYFFVPPPGVENCFEAAGKICSAASAAPFYCAYHTAAPVGEHGILVYANDPYVTFIRGCDDGNHPNGTTADAAIQGGLTHEQNESITDPIPPTGWFDPLRNEENGDKCVEKMGTPLGRAPNGAKYNQVINGHLYWTEQVWSNQEHRCLQRFTLSGAEPTATFTSTVKGRTASVDATGSTAPGGVAEYVWQFNFAPFSFEQERTFVAVVRSKKPTASYTFRKKGTFEVGLTVFAHDGTSIGTAQNVTVH
jgi:hypothetical protein